jgi:hypothetical protein
LNQPDSSQKPESKPPHPQEGPDVTITVNGNQYTIHRGHQTVAAIKGAASVPTAFELEQLVAGKLVPLADDGAVTLKGGEVFVAHPRDGASS